MPLSMNERIAVALCTHNPVVEVLKRTIASVLEQQDAEVIEDFVIIDNASATPCERVLGDIAPNRFRVVHEERRGVAHARVRAITETRSDIILFVDDDTPLAPDYVREGCALLRNHPFLGVLGGVGVGEYGGPVQDWMKQFLRIFGDFSMTAEKQRGLQYACTYEPGPWIPGAAGMFLRREVARKWIGTIESDPARQSYGRVGRGDVLMGGEDEDIALCAVDIGLAIGLSNKLCYRHIIPANRMRLEYFERLLYASNYSTARLWVSRGIRAQSSSAALPKWRKMLGRIRRSRNPEARCWVAFTQGYRDGMAGHPFDPRYR